MIIYDVKSSEKMYTLHVENYIQLADIRYSISVYQLLQLNIWHSCTPTHTHLCHIIEVNLQFNLLPVGNVGQLFRIGKHLSLVWVGIELCQETLDLLCEMEGKY